MIPTMARLNEVLLSNHLRSGSNVTLDFFDHILDVLHMEKSLFPRKGEWGSRTHFYKKEVRTPGRQRNTRIPGQILSSYH